MANKARIDGMDRLFSQWVRARAGWRCECCGRMKGRIECAHIYGRRNRQTRWDDANAISLCNPCHRYFTDNPVKWADWIRGHLGSDHVEAVGQRAMSTEKLTDADKAEIAAGLIAKLEEWGEEPVWKATTIGKKRAKKKAASKKKVSSGLSQLKGTGRKLNSGKYKKRVSGETVRREG